MSTAAKATAEVTDGSKVTMRQWAILGVCFTTSTLYAMTLLVVSVILPQVQGSLSASPDQISWTVTFNILATAIVTPISGWLAGRWGARNVMLFCMAGFGLASLACGFATSLESLIFFRILQGGLGAPLVPLPQAVVLAAFPRSQHAFATSIYGMGVVLGPILGPIYGGYLAELYGWRSAFFMVAPMAGVILAGMWLLLPRDTERRNVRFTWFGFMALSTALTCLQLILDRGQRLDWLDSVEIGTEAVLGILALGIFVAHSLLSRTPLLDFRHLANWNYALGLIIVTVYGMLNFTPMVLLPPMLKQLGGFPESIIGTLIAGRGTGAVIGFFLAGHMAKVDPRIGMTIGYVMQAWSGYIMWNFNADVSSADVMFTSLLQGVCVGLIWVPLTVSTFSRVDPAHLGETSAIFHLIRNLGSSIFISLSVTTVIRSQTANFGDLRTYITPFSENFQAFSALTGVGLENAADLARLNVMITNEAQLVGFLNAFGLYTVVSLAVLPFIWMVRVPKKDGG